MIVSPGLIRPSRSAASIIESPMRSLIEPPGFWFSSLANSRHGPVPSRVSSIMGVLPISSSAERAGCLRMISAMGNPVELQRKKAQSRARTRSYFRQNGKPPMNFSSDNAYGAAPEILHAIQAANEGAVPSYGEDPLTH